MVKIISGFPGIGKSEAVKVLEEDGIRVLDLESSEYSWLEKGVTRNPNFPNNYIAAVNEAIASGKYDYIMISSHKVVRDAMLDAYIEFTVVIPELDSAAEYRERYISRGNDQAFIEMMDEKWESFITEICEDDRLKLLFLPPGTYLSELVQLV